LAVLGTLKIIENIDPYANAEQYRSGIDARTVCSPFKTCLAFASETDVCPEQCEHTGQELMRALSVRVRN
jgi:hypothetical protein